jgi:DNA-binding transcriptional LysR family regulator
MDRLDELELLLAIIERGSLSGAAGKTGRSPAAVTRILNQMEARLRVRLVERTTRRLAPTDAGVRLAEHARRVLGDYEDAVQDVTGMVAAPSGVLRVTAPLVFGRRHVAPLIARFLDQNPQTRAELLLTNNILDLIEANIDIAVRIGPMAPSNLVARRVGEVRHVVVASPAYLARRGEPATVAALARHEIVFQAAAEGLNAWEFVLPGGAIARVRPNGRFVVNEAEAAIDAACAGRGLVRARSYQVVDELASGELIRILRLYEPPPSPVNLVFAGRRYLAQRIRTFVDLAALELEPYLSLNCA